MNAKDAIRSALKSSQNLMNMTLEDLSDQDLLERPVPGANHIAWQLGHVISSEQSMMKGLGATPPPLPEGFTDQHGKATAAVEPPKGFLTKSQYVQLFNATREATIEAAGKLSESDLDKPVEGNVARIAPTVGALALLAASHSIMHMGQFSVVRRKLGKKVLF
jgi:uncharacterized damage-inducible protein DinB